LMNIAGFDVEECPRYQVIDLASLILRCPNAR